MKQNNEIDPPVNTETATGSSSADQQGSTGGTSRDVLPCISAPSTDERLAEIAERCEKWISYSRQDTQYLLRLVAELRQKRDEYRHKWNDVLKHEDKALAMCRRLQARAEQAERERDCLAGLNPTP